MGMERRKGKTTAVCNVCGHRGPSMKSRGGVEDFDLEEAIAKEGWHGGGPFMVPHAILICPHCVSVGYRYVGGLTVAGPGEEG